MDNFGVISTADSLPIPEGPHVKDFDAAQKATKIAARAAKRDAAQPTPTLESDLTLVGNYFPSTADWTQPGQLDDEQLASLVADGATKVAVFCEALKPFYVELRERFRNKKSKEALIHGCKSWDEYCEKVLDRTLRAINYWLAGGNPGNEKAKLERKAQIEQQKNTGQILSPDDEKPSFAIEQSPIDGDGTSSKEDASRRMLAWNLSCLKSFSPEEKREVAEDLIGKLSDEVEFEAPQPPPIKDGPKAEPVAAVAQKRKAPKSDDADAELDKKARWYENEFRKLGMLNVVVASTNEAGKFDLTYLSIDGDEIDRILHQCEVPGA